MLMCLLSVDVGRLSSRIHGMAGCAWAASGLPEVKWVKSGIVCRMEKWIRLAHLLSPI